MSSSVYSPNTQRNAPYITSILINYYLVAPENYVLVRFLSFASGQGFFYFCFNTIKICLCPPFLKSVFNFPNSDVLDEILYFHSPSLLTCHDFLMTGR